MKKLRLPLSSLRNACVVIVLNVMFISSTLQANRFDFYTYDGFRIMLNQHDAHLPPCTMNADEIGGTVYREFEHNGTADVSDIYRFGEEGFGGVTVNIYDDDELLIASVESDPDGTWLADVSSASGSSVLVEFVPPGDFKSGPSGNNNLTAVLRADKGSCNNDFTIGKPEDHCQDNPTIATACFPGPISPAATLVTIEFEDSEDFVGIQDNYIYSPVTADEMTAATIASEINTGFINGIAWDRTHSQILSASFAKITEAETNNNIGEIYRTYPSSGITSLWLDLESVMSIDVGGSDFENGAVDEGFDPGQYPDPNDDPDVHNIGYIGFTDLEINASDSQVYVFNAKDRSVYIIPVDPISGDPITSGITSVPIPALCPGNNGNGNPYAAAGGLGFFDGRVYVSTTCTGPTTADLEGAIYSFDPLETSPTVMLELTIDYSSWQMPSIFIGGNPSFTGGTWLQNVLTPWKEGLSFINTATINSFGLVPGTGSSDFAPWALDIEFDIHPNGTVGMNIVTKNRALDATEVFNDPTNGGYLSKAWLDNNGMWIIESNGDVGPFMTGLDKVAGSTDLIEETNIFRRGQPDASFYHGEGLEGPSFNGGATVIPGFREIMTSNTDNVEGNYDSGFTFHNVSNGLKSRFVNILQGSDVGFAKGNSWGDLEALCELPPIGIGNYIWLDLDHDGFQDPSESPQAGVMVSLWKDTDDDGVGDLFLGTATTNAAGYYFFGGVLDANTSESLLPFTTYELRISLSDVQAANPNVTEFTLVDNTTDQFDSDFADTIIMGEPFASTTVSTSNTELVFHQLDAGLFFPTSIGDTVFVDLNYNGLQDREPGIEGVTVTLFDATTGNEVTEDIDMNPIMPQITNADGYYKFENLPAGDYYVEFDVTTNTDGIAYAPTLENVNGASLDATDSDVDEFGRSDTTSLLLGQMDCTLDAGYIIPGKIGDTVFVDVNFDGIQDAGDLGAPGVIVTLLDEFGNPVTEGASGPINPTTMTDGTGMYMFGDLLPGMYSVKFDVSPLPGDYVYTIENAGSDTIVDSDVPVGAGMLGMAQTPLIEIMSGDTIPTIDAGIVECLLTVDLVPSMDACIDPNPAPNNNDITAMPSGGLAPYTFEWSTGQTTSSIDDLTPTVSTMYSVTVTDALGCTAEQSVMLVRCSSIGDKVFYDANDDGIQDPDEPGVPGVIVTILDANMDPLFDPMNMSTVWNTTTDADGMYIFDNINILNGDADTLFVKFGLDPAIGLIPGTIQSPEVNAPSAGGPDSDTDSDILEIDMGGVTMYKSDTIILDLDQTLPNIDAGVIGNDTLGDYVWNDLDGDGVQDPMEPGIEDVVVYLKVNGVIVDDTLTDANGKYSFDNLIPNPAFEYSVQFEAPAGMYPTLTDQGGDDGLDSDADPTMMLMSTGSVVFDMPDEIDTSFDAGFFFPASVGDTVFVDNNGNGIQDAGETGIENVTVSLFKVDDMGTATAVTSDLDGNPLATTTDADGRYKFENLAPGNYYVNFDVSSASGGANLVATIENVNGVSGDPVDSDVDAIGNSDTVFVASGQMDCTLDAGYFLPVSVGDTVFVDANFNGLQDAGEPGLEGVTVSLFDTSGTQITTDVNGIPLPTMTGPDGRYKFENLAPNQYYVVFDVSTSTDPMAAAFVPTTQNMMMNALDEEDSDINTAGVSDTVEVASGEMDCTVDAGYFAPVAVGDTVFVDVNGNGLQDAGEPGIPGVTITLFDDGGNAVTELFDGTPIGTIMTDVNGLYKIDSLSPGSYYVNFDVSTATDGNAANYVATFENINGVSLEANDSDVNAIGDSDTTAFISSGEMDCTLDAGYFVPVSIGDTAWVDANGNGILDNNEDVLENVTVELFKIESGIPMLQVNDYLDNPLPTETDADGRYKFENLAPGEYQVRFTAPSGSEYVITLSNEGADDLVDSDAVVDDTAIRTSGTSASTILESGGMDCTLDAGFYEPVSVGDTVFVDTNGNGFQDDEPGIPNVPVALFDTSGTQITVDIFGNPLPTTTDGDGRYKFENLAPNQYYVVFDIENTMGLADAADYVPTIENVFGMEGDPTDSDIGANETSDTVDVASGGMDCTLDAGYFLPVSVGDTVFVDNNGNGVQDMGESGIPNVGVTLVKLEGGVPVLQSQDYLGNDISMVDTDSDGRYKFENLRPGQYYVIFDINNAGNGTNYYATYENINGVLNDASDSDIPMDDQADTSDFSLVLTSGQMDCTLDAGYFEPIAIGDTVFVDANLNGLQDVGEPGLSGVTATLFYENPTSGAWEEVTEDLDGNPIMPMVSDAMGRYKFENLPPGNYHVNFDSGGIPVTLQDVGTNDAIDSDVDDAGNSDTLVVLSTDVMNCTFDAGYQGLDYGDLPDTYVTADSTNMADAPKHVMREGKYLGALVDQDIDGGPSADGTADDNTGSPYVIPANASGNDEDGIEFLSPMLPGNVAYIKVTYTAPDNPTTDDDAFLNAWIDFDGNGMFDATDAVNFTAIDGAAITATTDLGLPSAGTEAMVVLEFEVPETAVFANGQAISRFRYSCDGGLAPDSGLALDGEIEDYVTPLGKIGNLVWLDENFDGLQDPASPEQVLAGVQVVLTYDTIANDQTISIIDTVETDANGLYSFCGLIASDDAKYQLTLITPDGYASSMMNIGSDETLDNDADIIIGEEGRDSIQTLPFMIMDVTMLPTGEAGQGDDPNIVDDFPDNQVDQTYDFGLVVLDFGDLPEDFGDLPINFATDEDGNVNPPKHIVTTNKRLGACVDSEPDGQPDPMGMGDDDNMASSSDDQFEFGTCTPGASDEDGIEFLTPLIPGDTAFIKVTYTLPPAANPGDQAGYLNAWIDFDGNGLLLNAASVAGEDDRVPLFETTGFAAGIARPNFPLDAGNDSMMILGFKVPEFATFNGGQVFSRFRLSCEGGLLPVGVLQDGSIPEGEVEDYVVPLTKIGNLVWLDQNYDGIQDTSATSVEAGLEGVAVNLTYTYNDPTRNIDLTISVDSITDENGKYAFCGLLPSDIGEYKITVISPDFYTPTVADNPATSDSLDSDHGMNIGDSIVMTDIFMIPSSSGLPLGEDGLEDDPGVLGTFRDSLFDQTFDFGFVPLDYGDLDSSFVTAIEDGGPVHVISEDKFLGQGVDAERTPAVDSIAGATADGDDNAPGLSLPEDATITDDEDGIEFITPLIPGAKATISVNYTLAEEDGFLNGWIDFNGNDMLDADEALEFFTEGTAPDTDGALASAIDTTVELCFIVPDDAVYNEGDVHARFRLSCEGGLEPTGGFPAPDPNGPQAPQGEVEDYFIPLAKIGNLAFFDNNLNGTQDSTNAVVVEEGVEGVNHILAFAGVDGVFDPTDFVYEFATDENGNYYVCGLIEGEYNLIPTKYDTSAVTPEDTIPQRYILTPANCNEDDNIDSDFEPNLRFSIPDLLTNNLVTGENGDTDEPGEQGFPDEQDQINFDEGWIPEPNIEAIANIAGVDFPESGQCGNFNVIADVCIQNTGFVDMDGELVGARLENIDIEINLGEQFMGAFVGVIGDPVILDTVEYEEAFMLVDDEDRPTENPDFDGLGDIDGSLEDGILEPAEIVCLRIEFEIRPEELPEEDAMNLAFNAVVSAGAINDEGKELPDFFNGGAQYMAVDSSDRMFAFDGTYDDPNEPEPLGDCYETSLPLSQQPINLSYDEDCMALITPQMVLTELDEACTNEEFPLGGYYRLQLEDMNGNIIIPFTDSLVLDDPVFIGNMYNIRATSVADVCNSSWGKVTVENKLDPVIECMSDTITCGELIVLAPPSVINNCGEIDLRLVNRVINDVSCEDAELQTVIVETWEVRDAAGVRMNSCTQTLSIEQLDINDVVAPATTDTTLSCTVGEMPSPEELGVPTLNGEPLFPDNFTDCGIFASFEDEFFDFGNDCTNGVQRTWTVTNWICGFDNSTTFTQLITLVDTAGPVLSGVPEDMTLSTSGFDCEASVTVPAITAVDDCNPDDIRIDISYDGGFIMDQNGATITLPVGTSTVSYVVYDVCGNLTQESFEVTVRDLAQPVTICDAFTTISLNSEGKASLSAESLDNGSLDECGPVTLEISRMDDDLGWLEEVDFTCADIGPNNIMVALRVTDLSGNSNQCMAEVTIQDKVPPVVVAGLPDITVSCTFPFSMDDLSVFGSVVNVVDSVKPIIIDDEAVQFSGPAQDGLILDNCATAEMSEIVGGDLDQCGNGTLIREITATSPNGETVVLTQNITFVNPTPFNMDDIDWPADITVESCSEDALNPQNLNSFPTYEEDICDMVGASFNDVISDFGGCKFKILRTWSVADWCQREDGVFRSLDSVQTITVNSTEPPTFNESCDDVTFTFDNNNCFGQEISLVKTATDNCLGSEVEIEFSLDYNADGTVDSTGTGGDASDVYPLGTHLITYVARSECGSEAECSFLFTIEDESGPVAVCADLQTVVLELVDSNNDGINDGEEITISPTLIDNGSFSPCGTDFVLSFSEDVNDTIRFYDCSSIGIDTLRLWITDSNGSTDFCETSVNISDDNAENICNPNPPVFTNCDDLTVESMDENCDDVQVTLNVTVTDECPGGSTVTYSIDLGNDGSEDITGMGTDASGLYPLGTHSITYTAVSACGAESSCSHLFTVVNTSGPIARCADVQTIILDLVDTDGDQVNDDEQVVVNISEIDNGSSVACGLDFDLSFTEGDVNDTTRTYNCSSVGEQKVTLWITDELGRTDSCMTTIIISDDNGEELCNTITECCASPNDFTGMAVVTCNVDWDDAGQRTDPVAKIYDVRNTFEAPLGEDWGTTAPVAPEIPTPNWTYDEIGPIFGIATDDQANVFLAQTDVYNIQDVDTGNKDVSYEPGWIYKAAPPTFMAEPFVQLPNTGGALNGIGNVVYDNDNDLLYASNLEDGKIYMIDASGNIVESYDPFVQDNGASGIVDLSEQIWGIGLQEVDGVKKLYFPRVTDNSRELYSIDVSNGIFPTDQPTLEISDIPGLLPRFTDLDFSFDGSKLIIAERGLHRREVVFISGTFRVTAHIAQVFNYELEDGSWVLVGGEGEDQKFFVGADLNFDGDNSAGGVSFGFDAIDGDNYANCDSLIWVSGNAMNARASNLTSAIYGIQGIKYSGNNSADADVDPNFETDLYVDLDGIFDNTDAKGNIGDVEIFSCGNTPTDGSELVNISGTLYTESSVEISEVQVTLEGADAVDYTDENGEYMLSDMPMGGDYTVRPIKNTEHGNGVTTLDLLHIQRHILGITALDSPYKLLAADINRDGKITGNDLLQLRKLILGLYDEFPANTSWRFIDADHVFVDPNDPWAQYIPETYEIDNLNSNMVIDFNGVKVGDVNGTAQVNGVPQHVVARSADEPFVLSFDDRVVKAGEAIVIPFFGDRINSISGYQLTMNIDPRKAEIVEARGMNGVFTEANFGDRFYAKGYLTSSWDNPVATEIQSDEPLFSIGLIAKKDLRLSEIIKLSDAITADEAYSLDGEILQVEVAVRDEAKDLILSPELYQNEPNPWTRNSVISFRLPEAVYANLRIYNADGKLVKEHGEFYEAGLHEYDVIDADFAARGVYYYELITDGYKLSKKMVLIK